MSESKEKKDPHAEYLEKLKKFDPAKISKKYNSDVEDLSRTEEVTSFGVPALDIISGIGGVLDGAHIEVFGKWSSTKTTLALFYAAQRQQKEPNRLVIFLNFEGNRSASYVRQCGVDTDPSRFLMLTPASLEDAFQLIWDMMKEQLVSAVIIDSLAAGAEREIVTKTGKKASKIGHSSVGSHSSAVGTIFRQITSEGWKQKITFWWNNQIRNLVSSSPYGPKETTTGGNVPKFYSYARIDLKLIEAIVGEDMITSITGEQIKDPLGLRIKATFVKNKFGKGYLSCCYNVYHQQGIDIFENRVEILLAKGLMKKNTKGFYVWKDESDKEIVGKFPTLGKTNTPFMYFREHEDFLEPLEEKYKDVMPGKFEESVGGQEIKENWEETNEAAQIDAALKQMKPEDYQELEEKIEGLAEGEVNYS